MIRRALRTSRFAGVAAFAAAALASIAVHAQDDADDLWGFDDLEEIEPTLTELFIEQSLDIGMFALFAVLWIYSSKPRPYMAVSGLFLLLYGVFRFFVEFYRVPDAHLSYLALGWVTMGQILSAPMILAGAVMLALAYRGRGRVAA